MGGFSQGGATAVGCEGHLQIHSHPDWRSRLALWLTDNRKEASRSHRPILLASAGKIIWIRQYNAALFMRSC